MKGIDKQWVAFYMEAKEKYESSDTIHGDFYLKLKVSTGVGRF